MEFRDFEKLAAAYHAASDDSGRPVLTGVSLYGDDGTLSVAATDSYVAMRRTIETSALDGLDILVPGRRLDQAASMLRKWYGPQPVRQVDVQLDVMDRNEEGDPHLEIMTDGLSFSIPLIDTSDGPAFPRAALTSRIWPLFHPIVSNSAARKMGKDAFIAYLRHRDVEMPELVDARQAQTWAELIRKLDGLRRSWRTEAHTVGMNPAIFQRILKTCPEARDHRPLRVQLYGPYQPMRLTFEGNDNWEAAQMPVRLNSEESYK